MTFEIDVLATPTGSPPQQRFQASVTFTGRLGSFQLKVDGYATGAPSAPCRPVTATFVVQHATGVFTSVGFGGVAHGNIDTDGNVDQWSIWTDARRAKGCGDEDGNVGSGDPFNDANDVND